MWNIGDRVIAVFGVSNGVVKSFGEGVYVGSFPLPEWVGGFNFGQDNPRIDLDSGKQVWGCECWWGSVGAMTAKFKDMKIELVDPDEVLGRVKHGEGPRKG